MIKPSDGATNVPSNLTIERRSPERVMRLERMGSAHPTRLSFLRTLLRRVNDENWRFEKAAWDINANGVGHAVYKAIGPVRTYSLIVFAHDLPDDQRSDRVIATAWMQLSLCLMVSRPKRISIGLRRTYHCRKRVALIKLNYAWAAQTDPCACLIT